LKAIIYSVPRCPHTARLRNFLKSKGVQFEEKCVLDSPQTMKEMIDISKQRGMPVTVLGEDVFVGFDSLIERRISRKLGGR
jgi:glutaredoxin